MSVFEGKTAEADYVKNPKIDLKDKKILSILGKNCRLTPTQIGKQVELSKEVVTYRLKRLEKHGLIRGNITVINPAKLGLQIYIILLQTQNMTEENEKQMINGLVQNPATHYIFKCIGKYDMAFDIIAPDLQTFDKVLRGILQQFKGLISHYDVMPIINVLKYEHIPKSFSEELTLKKYNPKHDASFFKDLIERKIDYSPSSKMIDQTDINILSQISDNGKLTLKEIAKDTKVSSDTVKSRIQLLIKQNVILGFQPIINLSQLGYHLYLLLINLNTTSDEAHNKIFSYLQQHQDIIFAIHTSGAYSITINVSIRDSLHLSNFLKELKRVFPDVIKTIETILIFKDYKIAFPSNK